MEKHVLRMTSVCFLVAGLLLAAGQPLHAQAVTPVPQLDQDRFTGTWYEVARYPNKREKNCVTHVVQLIALGDKSHQFQFVSTCTDKKGFEDARNATGRSKSANGALNITTIWPFSRKYWVLALGPSYEWALVGSPNHKDLWILSKTATLEPAVLADIKTKAAAQGFTPDRLMMQQKAE